MKTQNINTQALETLFKMFVHGIMAGKTVVPREYLNTLGLDYTKSPIGFNSGQFHHRKDEAFRRPYIDLGILVKSDVPVNDPSRIAYTCFGNYSLMIPLKDNKGNIVNLFSHRFKLDTPINEYLNDLGVFPHYPKAKVTTLYLVYNEIEASTMIQAEILDRHEGVLALREGKLSNDIIEAIKQADKLEKIVVINGDNEVVQELNTITNNAVTLNLPDNDSLNEAWLKYDSDMIRQCLDEVPNSNTQTLEIISVDEFHYKGQDLNYTILGLIPTNPTLLEMQFEIVEVGTAETLHIKLDLLNTTEVEKMLFNWTENKEANYTQAITELKQITEQLIALRQNRKASPSLVKGYSTKLDAKAKQLLKGDDVLSAIDALIGEAGIVGEERTRLLLFMIGSSYKFDYNLHGVVHSHNIHTASELIQNIASLLPPKDQYVIDVTTAKSFRYYGETGINNKCLVIPNYTGITDTKAIEDLKRLQTSGGIVIDAPKKTASGLLYTDKQEVKGHISSIGACDKSKKYFTDEPRTIIIGMDTTEKQLQKLMNYDCSKMAGMIDEKAETKAKELLQYIVNNLGIYKVVNPYASSLMLPITIPNARMLTMQLMNFVNITTLFNQYKRKQNKQGQLIVTKADIKEATGLFLDTIILNIDELDTSTRTFFDKLKTLIKDNGNKAMTSIDIREGLGTSKSTTNRFLSKLIEFEYIKKTGFKNTGFSYEIVSWSELESIKTLITNQLKKVA